MPDQPQKISLHPKFAAVLDGVLNIVLLLVFKYLNLWWLFGLWFVFRFALWGLLVRLVYYPTGLSRWRHFASLIFFGFGLAGCLLIFADWVWSWRLLALVFITFSAASFWLVPSRELDLAVFSKPYRRWLFLMDAFGLAGLWSGLFAIFSFQLVDESRLWLFALLGSLISVFVAGWWWREYDLPFTRRFWLGLLTLATIMFELAWTIWHWPLGYIANGLVMIWFWYILWLIMRFVLAKEGINWRKQAFFLVSSCVLFILFLLVVRWR